MSRHAVIKRAKIRRCRNLDAMELFKKLCSEKVMEMLSTYVPVKVFEIVQQPAIELTEQERRDRKAPRIDVFVREIEPPRMMDVKIEVAQ